MDFEVVGTLDFLLQITPVHESENTLLMKLRCLTFLNKVAKLVFLPTHVKFKWPLFILELSNNTIEMLSKIIWSMTTILISIG